MTTETNAATLVELDVDSIAAGGDGVGRTGGLVVFVPRTAPGDRALVRVTPSKRFGRGTLEELVRASAERVDPPCPHYRVDRCGGCQLQHVRYESQLEAKARIVQDALQRIGKRPIGPPRIHASARQWRYRTKLTLAMRRHLQAWTMGLHPYDEPSIVFQLEDCLITDERVVATWQEIRGAAEHLPATAELRGAVRLVPGGLAIVIEGGESWSAHQAFFDSVPSAVALWWEPKQGVRQLVAERAPVPAGASFGQVNAEVANALRSHVIERALSYEPVTIVDAYAGTGDTAVPLAEAGAHVTSIELDRDAAAWCAARLPRGSRALVGRVENLLSRALPTDVVVLNPPRGGLHERVTTLLSRPPRLPRAVLYVSCNPATLARDLARLPGYRVASVVSFDMFPQTAHVETVCELVPETA